MRAFHIQGERFQELPQLPTATPADGFLWLSCTQAELEHRSAQVQECLQACLGVQLVDLHVSDLLNPQLPSHFDYTSWYDLLIFRRLSSALLEAAPEEPLQQHGALGSIATSPVGFALFDRLLLSVHPGDCPVRDFFGQRLGQLAQGAVDYRGNARLPLSAADLMLRMVNHMVDSYLELRRLLSRELGALQQQLLDPRGRYSDWPQLLAARNVLSLLDDVCEDQRSAVQDWLDALEEWPQPESRAQQRERELLRVRSRDVLEHVERVLSHVRRLETSVESAVQMHYSALSHRTNNIMRTLTVLTAIFLPLNLITGIFGMNFDALPLIHSATGFWVAFGLMLAVGLGLAAFFWRKRYLSSRQ